jgi:hypothetical protein
MSDCKHRSPEDGVWRKCEGVEKCSYRKRGIQLEHASSQQEIDQIEARLAGVNDDGLGGSSVSSELPLPEDALRYDSEKIDLAKSTYERYMSEGKIQSASVDGFKQVFDFDIPKTGMIVRDTKDLSKMYYTYNNPYGGVEYFNTETGEKRQGCSASGSDFRYTIEGFPVDKKDGARFSDADFWSATMHSKSAFHLASNQTDALGSQIQRKLNSHGLRLTSVSVTDSRPNRFRYDGFVDVCAADRNGRKYYARVNLETGDVVNQNDSTKDDNTKALKEAIKSTDKAFRMSAHRCYLKKVDADRRRDRIADEYYYG